MITLVNVCWWEQMTNGYFSDLIHLDPKCRKWSRFSRGKEWDLGCVGRCWVSHVTVSSKAGPSQGSSAILLRGQTEAAASAVSILFRSIQDIMSASKKFAPIVVCSVFLPIKICFWSLMPWCPGSFPAASRNCRPSPAGASACHGWFCYWPLLGH